MLSLVFLVFFRIFESNLGKVRLCDLFKGSPKRRLLHFRYCY